MILLLIPLILQISGTDLGEINWAECKDNMKCLVPKKCLKKGGDSDELFELQNSEKDLKVPNKCEAGFQNKLLNSDTAIFHMQILGDPTAIDDGFEIIAHKGIELFGCKRISGNVTVTGNAEIIKKYKIQLFENRSHFSPEHVFCAVVIKKFNLLKDSKVLKDNANDYSFIKYQNSKREIRSFSTGMSANILLNPKEPICDLYSLQPSYSNDHYYVVPLKNKYRSILNCDDYPTSYKLMYEEQPENKPTEIKELKCADDESGNIEIVKKDNGPVPIEDTSTYKFYCASLIGVFCKKPPSITCKEPDEICPEFKEGNETTGEVATLECPNKKWVIDNKYYELDEQPICKSAGHNKAEFYTKFKTGEEIKFTEGRCFKDYDCYNHTNLDYPKCGNDSNKCDADVDYSGGQMKCKDKDKNWKVVDFSTNEEQYADYFICETTTGQWKTDAGNVVKEHSQVRCHANETFVVTKGSLTTEELFLTIGGIILGGILLGIIILGAMFLWYQMRQRSQVKGNIKWKFMSPADQLEHCKLVFGKASQSTPDSKFRISDGLRLLNVLFETETTEPKIWDEANWFIVRVQWTFETMEDNISFMFYRYLYLQAKEIIDNHGWLSATPITQANRAGKKGTEKELMRSVAIRLLSYCLRCPCTSNDSKNLLVIGFQKLGFEGIEQYPHCGLLWTAMAHCQIDRVNPVDPSAKPRTFDRRGFLNNLRTISKEMTMPEEDVIAEFGTPAMQAIDAIGGSADLSFHELYHTDYIADDLDGPRALRYLAAIGNSLYRNPATLIFFIFKSDSDKAKNKVAKMINLLMSLAPETEWTAVVERIMRLMSYFGKHLDAKKMPYRFVPNPAQLSQLSSQLSVDQHFFEEAAEAQKDELRRWLAARTDMKELKKKPVYTRNGGHDARIKGKASLTDGQAAEAGDGAAAAAAPQPDGAAPVAPIADAAAAAPAADPAPAPVASSRAAKPAAPPSSSNRAAKPAAAPVASSRAAKPVALPSSSNRAANPATPAALAALSTPNPVAKPEAPLVPTVVQQPPQKN